MDDEKLLQQALEALESGLAFDRNAPLLVALRDRLARPVVPYSGADETPPVFARRWRLADDGFGVQRDDDGPYVHIDDALSVLHQWMARPAVPQAEPVATLHDDGCFTWKSDVFRRMYDRERVGWRMDVYATPAAPAPVPLTDEPCEWVQDGDGDMWQAMCGPHRYFTLNEGLPSDNEMRHCCYCGRRLVEVPYTEEGER